MVSIRRIPEVAPGQRRPEAIVRVGSLTPKELGQILGRREIKAIRCTRHDHNAAGVVATNGALGLPDRKRTVEAGKEMTGGQRVAEPSLRLVVVDRLSAVGLRFGRRQAGG